MAEFGKKAAKNKTKTPIPDSGALTKKAVMGKRQITKDTKRLLYFPDDIMSKNFNNKRLYITIYKSKSVEDIETQLKNTYNRAKDKMSAASKTEGDAIDKTKAVASSIGSILNEVEEFKGEEKLIIALPLPNELSDSQAHGFSTDTGIVKDVVDTADDIASGLIGFSINKAIGRIASTLSVPRVLANPGYFQNYTGSEPRTFSFSFKMIPKSRKEADTIIEVIKQLKKHSSPSITANSIMRAPNFFHFWFSNDTLQILTGIRPCIISDIATNYAGSGILETTMDGMPKQIDITITIKELRTITEDKWYVKEVK